MRSSILEPLCITFLFLPRLFIDRNKKRSNKESLVAFPSLPSAPRLPLVKSASTAGIRAAGSRKPLPLQPLLPRSRPRAPQSESLWVLMAASGCVCVTAFMCVWPCVMSCVCTLMGENNSTRGFQLCCSVLDSMGGAESYRVSVSCVGSPASVHGLDNVPAPQSQKNLKTTDKQGFKHKPQRHSGTRTTRFA